MTAHGAHGKCIAFRGNSSSSKDAVLAQVIMNPFFTPTTRISSAAFHSKVRATARSFFR